MQFRCNYTSTQSSMVFKFPFALLHRLQASKCNRFSLCSSILLLISQQVKTRNNISLKEELSSPLHPHSFSINTFPTRLEFSHFLLLITNCVQEIGNLNFYVHKLHICHCIFTVPRKPKNISLFLLGTDKNKNAIPLVSAHLSFFNRNAMHVSEYCHEAHGNKVQHTQAVIFSQGNGWDAKMPFDFYFTAGLHSQ